MVTPFYAAIAALIFVVLSLRTIRLRRKLLVGIGTGNNKQLERAIGVHANCAEYMPIALLLIFFMESHTDSATWVHVLAIALLLGRTLHAYGVSQINENIRYRVAGMILTFFSIISASVTLLAGYATQ